MSVVASASSFKQAPAPLFAAGTGWTISIDAGVSDFTLTGDWESGTWYSVLAEILDEQEPCWSVDPTTASIDIDTCP